MNPQEQQTNQTGQAAPATQTETQKFFAAMENATPEQLDVQTTQQGDVQMNVINAVNANGIVSGRKVVDFIWQRMAICAMIIAGGCFIAVIVMVVIANAYNINLIKKTSDAALSDQRLDELYGFIGASSHAEAIAELAKSEILSGDDLKQVNALLTQKYGADVKFDLNSGAENFVVSNGMYRIVSLKIAGDNPVRAFLYMSKSDNQWKMAAYNSANSDNPCAESSDEEKKALTPIVTCPEVEVVEEE